MRSFKESFAFMEPEGSYTCSRMLAIGPYPKPAESSPQQTVLRMLTQTLFYLDLF
jgi:hypothetical protein